MLLAWLSLAFAIEVGVTPQSSWQAVTLEGYEQYCGGVTVYTQLDFSISAWGHFFLKGFVRTDTQPEAINSFDPYASSYEVSFGYQRGGVEIGFRHWCKHPVATYVLNRTDILPNLEGAYEEVYLRLEVETP